MASSPEIKTFDKFPPPLINLLIENFSIPRACFSKPPTSWETVTNLNILHLSIFVTLTFITLLSTILCVEEIMYLLKKVHCPLKKRTLVWSTAAPTVIAICSCVGLWIPRSAMFTDMISSIYFAVCFALMLWQMIEGFGGEQNLLEELKDTPMKISTGPCCCCCPCLPPIRITRRTLWILTIGTIQFSLLRPILLFIAMVLWMDGKYDLEDSSSSSASLWIGIILGAFTVLAMWPLQILFQEAKVRLADQNIIPKFALFQTLLILITLQSSILGMLANGGKIACAPPYAARPRAQLMNNHLMIIEMFIVAVVSRLYYRQRDEKTGYSIISLTNTEKDMNMRNDATKNSLITQC